MSILRKRVEKRAFALLVLHPEWRNGQAAFNALVEINQELANVIRGSHLDPFNDNSKVPDLLHFLEKLG